MFRVLGLTIVLLTFSVFINAQIDDEYNENYREELKLLVVNNNWEDLSVRYYTENELPYLNIWETPLIYLLSNNFNGFSRSLQDYAENLSYSVKGRFGYVGESTLFYDQYLFENSVNDELWHTIKAFLSRHPKDLLSQLHLEGLNQEQKQFLELYVYFSVWYFQRAEETLDKFIEEKAELFIENYPTSTFTLYVERFIIPREKASDLRILVDAGISLQLLDNELKRHIDPAIGFASSLYFYRKNLFVGAGINSFSASVKKDFNYLDTWYQDSASTIFMLDVSLGYSHRITDKVSISPVVTYRFADLSYQYFDEQSDSFSELLSIRSHSPMFGAFIDWEFAHKRWKTLDNNSIEFKSLYSQKNFGIRLGLHYSFLQWGRKTEQLNGNAFMASFKLLYTVALPKRSIKR